MSQLSGEQIDATRKDHKIRHWHVVTLYLILYDILAVSASYFIALWVRFDFKYQEIPAENLEAYIKFLPIYLVFCFLVFVMLHLYQSIWRFASYKELSRIILATVITSVFHIAGITILFHSMPVVYYVFGTVLQFLLVGLVRFSYRFILLERGKRAVFDKDFPLGRVMLVGAGVAYQNNMMPILVEV